MKKGVQKSAKSHQKTQTDYSYILQRIHALPWKILLYIGATAIVVIAILVPISSYNRMVSLHNAAEARWQQVEVQYQRRLDLIPNLVATVKAGQINEKTVLTEVTDARSRYASSSTVSEKAAAASQVDTALSKLFIVVESYPEIASNQLVVNLQVELTETENKISLERLRYNDDAQAYNTFVRGFPQNVMAWLMHFTPMEYFKAAPGSSSTPTINTTEE